MQTFIFTVMLFVTFGMTFYKIPLAELTPYEIFPWSPDPQHAKTSPVELRLHIITALILYLLSYLRYLYHKSEWLHDIFVVINVIFSVIVLKNVSHFGDFNPFVATIINGGLWVVMQLLGYFYGPIAFLTVLSMPILFEASSFLWTAITGLEFAYELDHRNIVFPGNISVI